jgi:hypothetical protein
VNHPDTAQLTAFGYGKLAEAETKQIVDHLGGCRTCQKFLDNLPDDDLLALIRPLFTPWACRRALLRQLNACNDN